MVSEYHWYEIGTKVFLIAFLAFICGRMLVSGSNPSSARFHPKQ
jgi:hypothetical protein